MQLQTDLVNAVFAVLDQHRILTYREVLHQLRLVILIIQADLSRRALGLDHVDTNACGDSELAAVILAPSLQVTVVHKCSRHLVGGVERSDRGRLFAFQFDAFNGVDQVRQELVVVVAVAEYSVEAAAPGPHLIVGVDCHAML